MKKLLDWQSKEVVDVFDEVTLWSAPFGRLLLENIPMKAQASVLDIGFGTGFPLIELSQRFGAQSKIYGVDIWEEGIARTKKKMAAFQLDNIELLTSSAVKMDIADNSIDLVTSNLGINNFAEKEKVYAEIARVMKADGQLCITTNPVGTFAELFSLFEKILQDMSLSEELEKFKQSIQRRNTLDQIVAEFEAAGFALADKQSDVTSMRFCDAQAVMDHALMRIGFRDSWEQMVRVERRAEFFGKVKLAINEVIHAQGEFQLSIPMLYLAFGKQA